MIASLFLIEDWLDEMVGTENLFGKNLTLMMKIIDTNTMTVLSKEDINVSIGRITMKLTLDIIAQTSMAITQGYGFTAQIIIKTT